MAGYNPNNSQNQFTGGSGMGGQSTNSGNIFSKMLRNVQKWGMNYNDMVVKNSYAVGINETPMPEDSSSMYSIFSQNAVSRILDQKSISYLNYSYPEKRRILREYSLKDKISEVVQMIVDEAIVYDDKGLFCYPEDLPEKFGSQVKQSVHYNFNRIYRSFGFDGGLTAWNIFKNLLVDGYLAFELIYDNKQRNIISVKQLDSTTLIPGFEPNTGDFIWIQYPEDPQNQRVLLDAQIIYISYSNTNDFQEISYVENLIRPYNQLRLLEQSRVMFNIINASLHKQFTIPTSGMSRQVAEQEIARLIADYKDEVTWDDSTGEVQINGHPHIPYSKEYWFPSSDHGTPQMQLVDQSGHDLNEEGILRWFNNNFKRASKIPMSRFEEGSGGGTILGAGNTELTRDELSFHNFVNRLRTLFKEVMVKPLKIQMLLDYPELKDDEDFHNSISVSFNGVNLFKEWRELNNLATRAEIFSTLSTNIKNKEDEPILPDEWLLKNVMKFSDEDMEEIEKYRKKSQKKGEESEEGMESGAAMGDFGGGADITGDDIGGEAGGEVGGEAGGGEAESGSGEAGGGEAGGGEAGGGEAGGGEEGGGEEYEI